MQNFNGLLLRPFQQNKTLLLSTLLFMTVFYYICHIQPKCFFKDDGSVRQFGIGYKKKTILPIWLAAIVLAIVSYFIVLFYYSYHKLSFR